jgi:hypothetical protein
LQYFRICKSYQDAIRWAKDDWKLSTDGVVIGLRYNGTKKQFVAKVNYTSNGMDKEEYLIVDDDWIVDVYGHEVMSKLMDRGSNDDFVLCPKSKEKTLAMVHLDGEQLVIRVKYTKGLWQGQLDNGKVITLEQGFMDENFSLRFLDECKKLGHHKFVPIPTGSSRCSIMNILPSMHCEGAPRVKYMQGDTDSCVFSSLASAFHCTKLPSLMQAANILVMRSKKFSGGVRCMRKAKEVVQEHVKWLQSKKLPCCFNWEKDLTKYMFVVGVMKDSGNSQQHAVTIFRDWIFDSNEPFALPLNKQNLDLCTWDVKDGNVIEDSLFVNFSGGWIFEEPLEKRKKILDHCVL